MSVSIQSQLKDVLKSLKVGVERTEQESEKKPDPVSTGNEEEKEESEKKPDPVSTGNEEEKEETLKNVAELLKPVLDSFKVKVDKKEEKIYNFEIGNVSFKIPSDIFWTLK